MLLEIKKEDALMTAFDIDKYPLSTITDENGLLGLSVMDGCDGTVYMSSGYKFVIRGFSKCLSPKTVEAIYNLPKPRSLAEVARIIRNQG